MITLDFSLMTKNSNSEPIKSTSSIYYAEAKITHEAFIGLCALCRMQRDDDRIIIRRDAFC